MSVKSYKVPARIARQAKSKAHSVQQVKASNLQYKCDGCTFFLLISHYDVPARVSSLFTVLFFTQQPEDVLLSPLASDVKQIHGSGYPSTQAAVRRRQWVTELNPEKPPRSPPRSLPTECPM